MSLGDVGDADPLVGLEGLLPEGYFVVAAGDGQHVAGHGPADVPDNVVERVQKLGRPRGRARAVVAAPDDHSSILQKYQIYFNIVEHILKQYMYTIRL